MPAAPSRAGWATRLVVVRRLEYKGKADQTDEGGLSPIVADLKKQSALIGSDPLDPFFSSLSKTVPP